MKLYLVQHGEAHSKDTNLERPLTQKGRIDVNKMSDFMNIAGVVVKQVYHSGKLRAKQTAEVFSAKISENSKFALTLFGPFMSSVSKGKV